MKEKVLQAMREFGAPVNAGKIAEITGIDRKEVDKAFAELKKEGAIVHKQQGMIFKAQGITKLGEKYINHFNEEMGWVEKFTERILDLGGDVKFEGMKSRDLICDPVEYVKADLAIQEPGVELLMKCMEGVKDDPLTYDLLKDYLKDEEEDLFWSQGAVELIEKIGTQNWLLLQL